MEKKRISEFKKLLESINWREVNSKLSVVIGYDVINRPFLLDLKSMPHLIIAGSSGVGKSICINSIILSLIYKNSAADLRFLLIDPKGIEYTEYNELPHLLTPVIDSIDKVISALRWSAAEMDRRLLLLRENNCSNHETYNKSDNGEAMPYIVIIIDEFADFYHQDYMDEVKSSILKLARNGRLAGIHLIISSQNPSIIIGLLKEANITNRISFSLASATDSQAILGTPGAEKLNSKGEMLFIGNGAKVPKHIQCVNITDDDVKYLTTILKGNN